MVERSNAARRCHARRCLDPFLEFCKFFTPAHFSHFSFFLTLYLCKETNQMTNYLPSVGATAGIIPGILGRRRNNPPKQDCPWSPPLRWVSPPLPLQWSLPSSSPPASIITYSCYVSLFHVPLLFPFVWANPNTISIIHFEILAVH